MNDHNLVRLAIAADQAIFRRGLTSLAASLKSMQMVGEAQDHDEALQLCELVKPDILLVSLHPQEAALDVARTVYRRWPEVGVILFASGPEDAAGQDGAGEGVICVLPPDVTEEEFADAILRAGEGKQPPSREDAAALAQAEGLRELLSELENAKLGQGALSRLMQRYMPLIFPDAQINLRVFPHLELIAYPSAETSPLIDAAFRWMRTAADTLCFKPGDELPWGGRQEVGSTFILAPICKGRQVTGGISILAHGDRDADRLLEIAQALAVQAAPAIEQAQTQARQSREVLNRELATAGKIQADILPEHAPAIPGWDIAARLESARETSGDFFDFIPLANQNWGIVIADVTDKGMGAALFMALSNTLIRTFAARYPTLPALTMSVVNERILSDTRGNMFVTAFYAVLEPHIGRLRFVNAGHPPPYVISTQRGKPVDQLRPTGMALGVMETAHWQQKIVRLAAGDVLVLYTDGITEAQNKQGDFYGEHRLLDVIRSHSSRTAKEIQNAVLEAVREFTGDAPRQDDIALVVIRRK